MIQFKLDRISSFSNDIKLKKTQTFFGNFLNIFQRQICQSKIKAQQSQKFRVSTSAKSFTTISISITYYELKKKLPLRLLLSVFVGSDDLCVIFLKTHFVKKKPLGLQPKIDYGLIWPYVLWPYVHEFCFQKIMLFIFLH